ncbi:hypothetical protein [Streptomyces sp. AC602_WCS936]|uniref:hypothetical protein n=1 Tax=Streptomyces sp. AC602_WCS936 TaxID=2823685 RepID=UPI0020B67EE6|nr:hypothetical protein [Streptomyces sp. AC602_WCS936]
MTSRVEFEFSVDENETPPSSGFDLGHIDVLGGEGAISSRDRGPDGAMMIYLSVTLLLDGLRRLLCGKERSYRSAAVETTYQGALVDRSPAGAHLPLLPVDDEGREDLEHSLALKARRGVPHDHVGYSHPLRLASDTPRMAD